MHSILFTALLSIGLALLQIFLGGQPQFYLALLLGYLSHLLADSLTKNGTQLLYPLPLRVKLLPKPLIITTGSIFDYAFGGLCLLILIMWLSTNPDILMNILR